MTTVADSEPRAALLGPVVPVHAPHGVPGLVRSCYARTRDAVVCADPTRTLTGREVELLSDTLADTLRRALPAPGPVILRLRRSVDRAVAVLAVLKAGRAYLPVELAEPPARVAAMVEQARPVAVVQDGEDGGTSVPGLPSFGVPAVADRDGDPAPLPAVAPDQPVYVMFTSGSTGRPKGVVLGSQALCSHLLWMQRRYPLTADDRVLQKTPYTFDPSAWELLLPLLAGARCELAADDAHRDPTRLAAFMVERGITVCHFVPSMLAEFVRTPRARDVTSLRHVFCSGEALTAALAGTALGLWPTARLHNLYGPTEAAIDVTAWDVPPDLGPSDPVPIGDPVDNTVLAVLDDEGRPAPDGEPGELWIGGDQVALGYAGQPDLTAAAFPTVGGRRWYRTGDIVRHTRGALLYQGRVDEQVKVGGVRVEPLEVEAVLGELHPRVAVVAVPEAADGDRRRGLPGGAVLVAAVAGEPAPGLPGAQELHRHAAARLPAAMVPADYCPLPAFPVGPTGKLDRRRLADQVRRWWERHRSLDAADQDPGDGPADPLATIWARALRIRGPVDETLGFIAAGGTSLAAIRLVGALREAVDADVPVSRLLDEGISLAELRRLVSPDRTLPARRPGRDAGPDPAAPRTSPLSPGQRRLWLLSRIHPDSPAYNVTAVLRFRGPLRPAALAAALDAAVRRHDVLRARIVEDADGGVSLRYEPHAAAVITQEESAEPLDAVLDGAALRAGREVISERQAPMLRAHLLRSRADGESCLVLVLNHLVADQETVDLLLQDLARGYAAALSAAPAADDEPAPSFGRYAREAAARRGDARWTADLAYWRVRLAGAPPELRLPFRLADAPEHDVTGTAHTVRLSPRFRQRLDAHLRERRATRAGFFLAVLGAVLSAWSGQEAVVVGMPGSARRAASEQALAGFLVDTLPIRLDLAGRRTFDALLRHARARCAEAMDHASPSFDAVVSQLRLPHGGDRNPVFQVWLNDLTGAAPPPDFAGTPVEAVLPPVHSALFDLGLYLYRDGDGLALQLVRAVRAYPQEVARELGEQCAQLAARVLEDPDLALDDLDLVTADAATVLPRPDRHLPGAGPRRAVLDRIAATVARTPDAVAVTSPDGDLTYRQLWHRAGLASAGLLAAGAGPSTVVALHAGRDGDLPVAVLAGWLAGVVPALIDASLPAERCTAAAHAVGARLTVATGRLHGPPAGDVRTVSDLVLLGATVGPVPAPLDAGGLSHLLLTSGTTGVPAPVTVPHGPLRDFLDWYLGSFGIGATDRFALLAGTGHDPVLREMFGALVAGARLHVPGPEPTRDVARLLGWLAESRITVLHATPALLDLLVRAGGATGTRLDDLRLVVVGGAPLAWGLVRRLRSLTGAELVNAYGTTETPQIVACHRLAAGVAPPDGVPDAAQVPVGRGVAGQELLVRTATGRPAGIGQLGEVVVRGRNLAVGYADGLGPADRFADDPHPGVRTFRTGDRGRYGSDGLVHLAGRGDRQVSIGGHRVELGDVEATALRHPLVRHAIATLVEYGLGPVLALQVSASGPLDVGEMRAFLRDRLPRHAVPNAIRVGEFALGPTGKPLAPEPGPPPQQLDDECTGEVAMDRPSTEEPDLDTAPGTPGGVLVTIDAMAREVLGRRIQPDENFFDAGLTSLLLVQLHEASTRQLPDPFPVTAMFAYPNLRALRRYLTDGESAARPAPARSTDGAHLRRTARARRELRGRIRTESELP